MPVGTDIVRISRIKSSIDRFGNNFLNKIFTEQELSYVKGKAFKDKSLAARFAAKESFVKALGTGFRDGISFKEVEVVNNELGKPVINLYGKAQKAYEEGNFTELDVSLSHDGDYATAVVLIK